MLFSQQPPVFPFAFVHQAKNALERKIHKEVHDTGTKNDPERIADTFKRVRSYFSKQWEQFFFNKIP
jgi:hypothetical protein